MDTPSPSETTFQPTKWTLIREARQRPEVLREIIAAYYPALRSYLRHLSRRFGFTEERVEDLLHEFVVQSRCLAIPVERADPQRGQFRSLLRTSVYRMVIDRLRKQRSDVSLAVDPADESDQQVRSHEDDAFDTGWAETVAHDAIEGVFRWAAEDAGRYKVWNVFKARYLEPEPWPGSRILDTFGRESVGNVDASARSGRRKFQDLVLALLGRQTASREEQDAAFRDFFNVIYRHDRIGEWRASDLPFLFPTRNEFGSRLMFLGSRLNGVRFRGLVAETAAEVLLDRWLAMPVVGEAGPTVGEVLGGTSPSIEELKQVKAFAMDRRFEADRQAVTDANGTGERIVASEVALWLYYTALAMVVYQHHARISDITDEALLEGTRWAADQMWGLPRFKPILEAVAVGYVVRY